LIKAVPQLKDVADLTGEQVANIGSQTMNHDVWLKLAKRVNEELSPQKARILLMLALMNTNDPVKLRQVFTQY
jgi:L-asparaginase/Glu-tRNA(Gln) amidotransferase subunit D